MLVLGAFVGVLWTTAAQALEGSAGPDLRHGTLVMQLTDRQGKPQARPILDVANGYPGMPAVATTLTVSNAGSEPATYAFSVAGLSSRDSLADVLVARVRDESGSVRYQGALRSMAFAVDQPLSPGSRATYSIEIRWPAASGDGNRYQGQQLSLALRLSSQSA